MSITNTVRTDMTAAMKARDTKTKEALSALLAALKAKAIDKRSDLTTEEEIAIVSKEIKQLKESIATAPAGYEDVITDCTSRIEILSKYMPKQMDEDEIKSVITDLLKNLGLDAPTPKDKGIIMKNLMPLTQGKADGKLVNEILASFLNN